MMGISSANMAPHIPKALLHLRPLLDRGDIKPHIGRELPLDEANDSHELVLSGKFLGKVVLNV
jgi:NADPH:quinone reductase-like Zn-dependent oxidoreductase